MPGAGYVKPTIAAAVRDGLNKMTEFFNPVAKSGRKAKKRAAPKPSKGAGTTAPAATGTATTSNCASASNLTCSSTMMRACTRAP